MIQCMYGGEALEVKVDTGKIIEILSVVVNTSVEDAGALWMTNTNGYC